jgi:TatD DNase family protein
MTFVDSHAHLYMEEFTEDRTAVMQRAMDAGVDQVFLPNIDSSTVDAMLGLEKEFPEMAHPMMGLHPCSVKETAEAELQMVKGWLAKRTFAAVGEIGLDFYWDVTFKEQQMAAFSTQIDWALRYGLPIVIHSRASTRECIDIVRSKQNGELKGVFHCFSGTMEEAREIMDLGFYLGIGGVVTFKKSTLPELLKDIAVEHLLLETDAPYLAPTPHRGGRNESAYIPLVAGRVAAAKGLTVEEVGDVTTANARKLFVL